MSPPMKPRLEASSEFSFFFVELLSFPSSRDPLGIKLSPPKARIQDIIESVAEKAEAQDYECDRKAGRQNVPPRTAGETPKELRVIEHQAPCNALGILEPEVRQESL